MATFTLVNVFGEEVEFKTADFKEGGGIYARITAAARLLNKKFVPVFVLNLLKFGFPPTKVIIWREKRRVWVVYKNIKRCLAERDRRRESFLHSCLIDFKELHLGETLGEFLEYVEKIFVKCERKRKLFDHTIFNEF